MSWDYAELSKWAKSVGGPEQLVDKIEKTAKEIGRKEGQYSMGPWIGIAFAAGAGLVVVIKKVVDYFKEKKAISQEALDQAKAELINGIKEYDANHPEV